VVAKLSREIYILGILQPFLEIFRKFFEFPEVSFFVWRNSWSIVYTNFLGAYYFMQNIFFVYFFDGLECVGHSFAYVARFVFLKDVWVRTKRAAIASRRATN